MADSSGLSSSLPTTLSTIFGGGPNPGSTIISPTPTLTSLPTTTVVPTATELLLALTTPFSQPLSCTFYDLSTSTETSYVGGSVKLVEVQSIISDPADPRFGPCQPSGWATNMPANRLSFSPAVCPTFWTYYSLGQVTSHDTAAGTTTTYSTALCCAPKHTPKVWSSPFPNIDAPCTFKNFGQGLDGSTYSDPPRLIEATESHGLGAVSTFSDGTVMHQAWHITWAASDVATMSPQPPALTSRTWQYEWYPGPVSEFPAPSTTWSATFCPYGPTQSGDPTDWGDCKPKPPYTAAEWFGMCGVPFIAVVGIFFCVRAGVRQHRKSRRRAEELARDRNAATDDDIELKPQEPPPPYASALADARPSYEHAVADIRPPPAHEPPAAHTT